MLSREIPPQLRLPATSSGRSPVRVTIEVMVDSIGIPDMATFRASGFGAAENRDALSRWIQQVMFRPAQLEGHAVRGLYRMKLEARVQAR